MVAMPAWSAACGEPNVTGSPAEGDLAGVGLVGAGQHLDQGGLAGAVLAEQAVHLAGRDVEVDAVQRADAGELLDDAPHREQRRHGSSHIGVGRPGAGQT